MKNVELVNKFDKNLNQLMKLGCIALGNAAEEGGLAMSENLDPLAAQALAQCFTLMKNLIDMERAQAETLDTLEEKMGKLERSLGELTHNISELAILAKARAESK